MQIDHQPPASVARPGREMVWFAKEPEERFESASQMVAAVQIPKQGLPARQEVSTHSAASASYTLEAAAS